MRLGALLRHLLLTPLIASPFSHAEAPRKISLQYDLKRLTYACHDRKTIPLGSEILLCDDLRNGKRLQVRAQVEDRGGGQYSVRTRMEEVDETGVIRLIGSPTILTLLNEEANIQIGDLNQIDLSWSVVTSLTI